LGTGAGALLLAGLMVELEAGSLLFLPPTITIASYLKNYFMLLPPLADTYSTYIITYM